MNTAQIADTPRPSLWETRPELLDLAHVGAVLASAARWSA